MLSKKQSRLKRAKKMRGKIALNGRHRLCVFRTPQHIYAQIFAPGGATVVASASSLDKTAKLKTGGNVDAAKAIGTLIAERAKKAGITQVAFDRSGFKYHGRVKALAEAVRECGIEF